VAGGHGETERTMAYETEVMLKSAREYARSMSDEQLMTFLGKNDPNCEHDDLQEPDGELSEYWREAGDRGLLNM
jgi:hypothetical protein